MKVLAGCSRLRSHRIELLLSHGNYTRNKYKPMSLPGLSIYETPFKSVKFRSLFNANKEISNLSSLLLV